jgi:hypothetical protein
MMADNLLTPWRKDDRYKNVVLNADGNPMCGCHPEEAASLVITAVNAFSPMREALTALLKCGNISDRDPHGPWADEETEEAVAKARAALALAEKQS